MLKLIPKSKTVLLETPRCTYLLHATSLPIQIQTARQLSPAIPVDMKLMKLLKALTTIAATKTKIRHIPAKTGALLLIRKFVSEQN